VNDRNRSCGGVTGKGLSKALTAAPLEPAQHGVG
jgi:hypothetical protein